MNQEFAGKVAVVTGSSGIGLGAALKLAELGARVHLCGNSEEHNAAARDRTAGKSISVEAVDVSNDGEVERLASRIRAEGPEVHVLVNAAAIQPYGTVETTSPDDWDRTMGVNLRSYYLMSHFLYPMMKGRPGGASIIHFASVQGHSNQRNVMAYATSKGAIHALTRAMAVDCARDGVRVNSISPGSIRTPMLEFSARSLMSPGGSLEETIERFGAGHPVGRVGTIDEVAELVAFLASPRSGFCTGSDFAIDGGLRAQLGVQ
ncbi:MAG: SDR family oxidoreductase [Rhizobiales bacterium]|nr:SDR family oxidoreductase [Hyphomicrobiales bacterium]